MKELNLSKFKLSAEQVGEFRIVFEKYRDDNGPRWNDEEIREMAMEIILFVLTVSQFRHQQD